MNLPDDLNTMMMHIGDEQEVVKLDSSPARLSRALGVIVLSTLLLTVVSLSAMGAVFNKKIQESQKTIAHLIDEVGELKQERFGMANLLESQQAVLQSIEDDFSSIQEGIDGGEHIAQSFGDLGQLPGLTKTQDVSELEDGTFDFMILGTNGSHTDTIMIASVNEEKQKITVFSIPRDLYVNGRRINAYFTYYGEDQLERMIKTVTGLTIDRYLQVDMDAFVALVDIVEGVDIYVDQAIYDGYYPNSRGGYSPYQIEVGHYHMNGEQALKYARSRKSTSDFDRAARQQKILTAVRIKLNQMDDTMDTATLTKLFQGALAYVETDISLFESLAYYTDYKSYEVSTGFVLSNSNYLYSMINESGAYTLLPKAGDFSEIQKVISELVN